MADIVRPGQILDEDLPAHQQTFNKFNKLILFSILHIALVLSCLALAFLGGAPLLGLLFGVGGTVVLLVMFSITS